MVTSALFFFTLLGLVSSEVHISPSTPSKNDQEHSNLTFTDGNVTVSIFNNKLDIKTDNKDKGLSAEHQHEVEDMEEDETVNRPAPPVVDPNGFRRGYGGSYKPPFGYSSHEWGLGKG